MQLCSITMHTRMCRMCSPVMHILVVVNTSSYISLHCIALCTFLQINVFVCLCKFMCVCVWFSELYTHQRAIDLSPHNNHSLLPFVSICPPSVWVVRSSLSKTWNNNVKLCLVSKKQGITSLCKNNVQKMCLKSCFNFLVYKVTFLD